MQEASYDVVIVGGGAAGLTAALYSCRAGLNTVLLERMMTGGQVLNAERIENFPGFPDGISGAEFGPLLQDQAGRYGLEIRLLEVTGLHRQDPYWVVGSYDGDRPRQGRDRGRGLDAQKAGRPRRRGAGGCRRFVLRHM